MTTKLEQEQAKHKEFFKSSLELAKDMVGAGAGAALGFYLNDPTGIIGSVGGVLVAKALRSVGQEISNRYLSNREKIRAGCVLLIAASEIQKKIKNGENIRQDGFFDSNQSGRSDAEEVAESVILKCQREPQEKKIQFMGYLLANFAFRDDISPHMAHQIVNNVEGLTYRQLCLLRIAACVDVRKLRDSDYREQKLFPNGPYDILYECFDLYHKELINLGGEHTLGLTGIWPAKMRLQGLGRMIHDLMHLERIPNDDLTSIANRLM